MQKYRISNSVQCVILNEKTKRDFASVKLLWETEFGTSKHNLNEYDHLIWHIPLLYRNLAFVTFEV